MTAQPVRKRRTARVCLGLAIAAALATSACAAGQRAQTADESPTLDGTEASIGNLDLRGVVIGAPTSAPSFPAGSSVQLKIVITNQGQSADRLTSITSSAITSWSSYSSPANARLATTPRTTAAAPSSTAASSSSSATSGSSSSSSKSSSKSSSSSRPSSATSSTSAAPTSAASTSETVPAPNRSIAIPAGSRTSWGVPDSTLTLVLTGLRQRLFPGNSIRLTFGFSRAGRVSFLVPVALTTDPKYSYIPEPSGADASATD